MNSKTLLSLSVIVASILLIVATARAATNHDGNKTLDMDLEANVSNLKPIARITPTTRSQSLFPSLGARDEPGDNCRELGGCPTQSKST